ncbi:hypothetical protein J1605_006134 [Eschrichtius robustus]|uniref:CLEC16A/TT9 C-terminal domain-containing protein n=1 Tax=Eschrichtius robustus TaxID=9764 RepID=A0AB34H7G9_ESCRO|nr:hypothetical protein J1605_006134 [Eschrichtius robustus]
METEARRGESSKQGAWDSEPDSDCSSAPWIPPCLCAVHPAGPEAGALSGTRKPTQQVVCAKAGATDVFSQATSITNSFLNSWLERPPDWLSTTPCCYLGAGQAHCVPGHHRCHHVYQLQVVLALTEIKAKPSIRCFIKPTETLERSLEMNKHKGKRRVQKRPNYKNVGEEEDEEKGPAEDAQEDAEKAKGTEGGSKGTKTSGESEAVAAVQPAPQAISPDCGHPGPLKLENRAAQ